MHMLVMHSCNINTISIVILTVPELSVFQNSSLKNNQYFIAHWSVKWVLTISGMVRYPWEKTMALGGVATGNMKAKGHAMAAAIIRYSGLRPALMDWLEKGSIYITGQLLLVFSSSQKTSTSWLFLTVNKFFLLIFLLIYENKSLQNSSPPWNREIRTLRI